MSSILKKLGVIALIAVGATVLVGVVIGLLLVFPMQPKSSPALRFAGFVELPKVKAAGVLSVLDYLTIDGRSLFVTSESSGAVYRVPLSAGAPPSPDAVDILPGAGAAHGVAIDPASGLAFASHSESNTIDVFEPSTLKQVKQIPVDEDVDGIFFEPNAKLIYAVHGDPNLATLIDPRTQTKLATIALGGKPEFAAYDPQTKTLYQNLEDRNSVVAVDLQRRAVVASWGLGACSGPTSMALDLAHRRMFVACNKNAMLVVLNLDSHRVVASLAVGGGPDSIAYDPALERLYVTGKSGVLTVVQQDGADRYRVRDNVRLHYGAHTLAFDGATGRLYVGYASLLIAPRLAVFETGR